MATPAPALSVPSVRTLAEGAGWRVAEVTCRAGPQDPIYQEQHDWTCIAAVLDGTFQYRAAHGQALMTPGSLLLGNAGTCFECGHAHGRGDRCVTFQFAPDLVEDTAGALRGATGAEFRAVRIPPLDRLLPLMARIRGLVRAPDALRAEDLALSLAATVLALNQDTTEAPPDARHERRITQAVRLIEARFTDKLTIADLARAVGMRRRQFASVFRQVTGVTPYRYILHCRLVAAAGRLRDGRSSVLEVALETGFGDLSEFTRRFHATFGHPPALYRRGGR
jgi:AraC family transcriptional regulator